MLSAKPIIYAANVADEDLATGNAMVEQVRTRANPSPNPSSNPDPDPNLNPDLTLISTLIQTLTPTLT